MAGVLATSSRRGVGKGKGELGIISLSLSLLLSPSLLREIQDSPLPPISELEN